MSPLSVNISTTEFSLLASPLKVIPETTPGHSRIFSLTLLIGQADLFFFFFFPLLPVYLSAGRWEWGGHNGRRCPASAVAALGDQRHRCGLYSLWPQTHHYNSHHQVLILVSRFSGSFSVCVFRFRNVCLDCCALGCEFHILFWLVFALTGNIYPPVAPPASKAYYSLLFKPVLFPLQQLIC